MESFVKSSNIDLHNGQREKGCSNAPNSVKEREADNIRYHWTSMGK